MIEKERHLILIRNDKAGLRIRLTKRKELVQVISSATIGKNGFLIKTKKFWLDSGQKTAIAYMGQKESFLKMAYSE